MPGYLKTSKKKKKRKKFAVQFVLETIRGNIGLLPIEYQATKKVLKRSLKFSGAKVFNCEFQVFEMYVTLNVSVM